MVAELSGNEASCHLDVVQEQRDAQVDNVGDFMNTSVFTLKMQKRSTQIKMSTQIKKRTQIWELKKEGLNIST